MWKLDRVAMLVVAMALSLPGARAEQQAIVRVGDRDGYVASAEGPGNVQVNMGDCRFSLRLTGGQHISFNGPDVVFYQSAKALAAKQQPYLWQAPMSHGYFWSFRKDGAVDARWFGLMCEDASDFDWSVLPGQQDQLPAELQDIMSDNAQRCPAIFKQGKWTPAKALKTGVFRPLSGPGWSGFVLAYPAAKPATTLTAIQFCLVHGRHVLIGAAQDDRRELAMPIDFLEPLVHSLSSLRFEDAAD